MGQAVSKANPERKRMRFSKEFKLEAVRLVELGQKPEMMIRMQDQQGMMEQMLEQQRIMMEMQQQ